MSILVTAIRSGNLEVVKEKFARPVSLIIRIFRILIITTVMSVSGSDKLSTHV